MRHITLITTGGTIEKTYDEPSGQLVNQGSIVRRMLGRLRLEDTSIRIIELMSKDSLLMTDDDRARVVEAVRVAGGAEGSTSSTDTTGIVILHGTDRLADTGERLLAELKPRIPIILTGAMRPFEMKRSDALQNLTEAIFAAGILAPGIYCTAHGRALPFPGVCKNRERNTFTRG